MSNWRIEMPADYYKRSPWAIAAESAVGAVCGLGPAGRARLCRVGFIPMTIPGQVKVGPFRFSVERYEQKPTHDAHGYCDTVGLVIGIADDVVGVRLLDTFIHELTHAMHYAADLKDGDEEERIVTRLAISWAGVLVDNPGLGAWLDELART